MGRTKLRPRRPVVLLPPTTPPLPSPRELAEEVEICRRAQRVWARTRTPAAAARMAKLEASLDLRLAKILATRELPVTHATSVAEDS